ncbi:MAG: helix-turn-helix transcriptional regulator [Chloroflexota bacterium]
MRVGSVLALLRKRKAWRQADLARVSGVSRATVSRLERGQFECVSVGSLRRVAKALEARIDLMPRWRAGELDRLLDAGHAALVATVVERLRAAHGWIAQPEVSFSIWGERGSIDILAFHPLSGMLLVIEVKTMFTDLQETLANFDRKRRLAVQIAAERGWKAASVSSWLVMADTHTNRRRVATNDVVLHAALPADVRTMHRWIAKPSGPIHALSFLSPGR